MRGILEDRWRWLHDRLGRLKADSRPSSRRKSIESLAGPVAGFLRGMDAAGTAELAGKVGAFFQGPNDIDLSLLVALVAKALRKAKVHSPLLAALCDHAISCLQDRLRVPERSAQDWSITWSRSCRCNLCVTLSCFLASPGERVLEWPLAQDGRRHIHGAIDSAALPVTHVTRRSGRPYTLVLTKTAELFKQEADLRSLRAASSNPWRSPQPERASAAAYHIHPGRRSALLTVRAVGGS